MMSWLLAFIPTAVAAKLTARPPDPRDDEIKQLREDLARARKDRTNVLDNLAREREMRFSAQREAASARAQLSVDRANAMAMYFGGRAMPPPNRPQGAARTLAETSARLSGSRPDRVVIDDPHAKVTGFGPSTLAPDLPPLRPVRVGLDLARDAMDESVLFAQPFVPGLFPGPAANDSVPASVQQVSTLLRESMEAYLCNCAPGRHEMFMRGPDRV